MEMEARTRATKSRASACSPSKHDADKHSRYSSLVHSRVTPSAPGLPRQIGQMRTRLGKGLKGCVSELYVTIFIQPCFGMHRRPRYLERKPHIVLETISARRARCLPRPLRRRVCAKGGVSFSRPRRPRRRQHHWDTYRHGDTQPQARRRCSAQCARAPAPAGSAGAASRYTFALYIPDRRRQPFRVCPHLRLRLRLRNVPCCTPVYLANKEFI